MGDKKCTICKHYGLKESLDHILDRSYLYDDDGSSIGINLCRSHSVELFKKGQKKFLISHYKLLVDIVSSDENKFLDILEKTVRNNVDQIS